MKDDRPDQMSRPGRVGYYYRNKQLLYGSSLWYWGHVGFPSIVLKNSAEYPTNFPTNTCKGIGRKDPAQKKSCIHILQRFFKRLGVRVHLRVHLPIVTFGDLRLIRRPWPGMAARNTPSIPPRLSSPHTSCTYGSYWRLARFC